MRVAKVLLLMGVVACGAGRHDSTQSDESKHAIEELVWSPDGAYLLARGDGLLTLWGATDAPRATIGMVGDGVVVLSPDGDVRLFGDTAAARSLLECRVGNLVFPFALCEDRSL